MESRNEKNTESTEPEFGEFVVGSDDGELSVMGYIVIADGDNEIAA